MQKLVHDVHLITGEPFQHRQTDREFNVVDHRIPHRLDPRRNSINATGGTIELK
jgi:hypothetical protein